METNCRVFPRAFIRHTTSTLLHETKGEDHTVDRWYRELLLFLHFFSLYNLVSRSGSQGDKLRWCVCAMRWKNMNKTDGRLSREKLEADLLLQRAERKRKNCNESFSSVNIRHEVEQVYGHRCWSRRNNRISRYILNSSPRHFAIGG